MDFDLGGLISMIGGAALQARAQRKALDQQKQLAQQMQQRQLQSRDDAAAVAAAQAARFAPEQRIAQQQQIQQDLTGQLDQQVAQPQVTAQGVQVGATLPEGQGSTEYLTAKAKEQAKTTASLHALAGLMGRVGSADELRRGEAVGMGDAAQSIGRIQGGAGNIASIDEMGVQSAGQPNLGAMVAGEALRAYGGNRVAMNGVKRPTQYPAFGAPSGPTGAWT